jgi:hypothetical protein
LSVQQEVVEHRSPMNYERGATALIRSMRLLAEAREELRLAARIFVEIEDGMAEDRLHRLVGSIRFLEASERALGEAWPRPQT